MVRQTGLVSKLSTRITHRKGVLHIVKDIAGIELRAEYIDDVFLNRCNHRRDVYVHGIALLFRYPKRNLLGRYLSLNNTP